MTNNTIAAISTPVGPGGIGIIRISGSQALDILNKIFIRSKSALNPRYQNSNERTFQSHRFYHGFVIDSSKRIIDEVLAVYMRAPKSYTREDIVEIHSHSGYIVLDRLLTVVLDDGACLAEPGEFTKRAFLNGRIDISQAEAVIDLITAPCEKAATMAVRQMTGEMKNAVEDIVTAITGLQAECEAFIEFEDTICGEEAGFIQKMTETIRQQIYPEIASLINRSKDMRIYRDGVTLAIAGVPNVGKSSLLNRLVEKEAAIVSDFPGTTRDVVREFLSICGIPVVICDTAGIHETSDPVECMGIEKARSSIEQADIVLLVVEANRRLNPFEEKLIDENKDKQTIVVINKDDLSDDLVTREIEKKIRGFRYIRVSAKYGTGIDTLKKLIFSGMVGPANLSSSDAVTPTLRQRRILEAALQEFQRLVSNPAGNTSSETLTIVLAKAKRLLEEVCGQRSRDDLYDHIFNQFCIGK